MKKDSGQTVGRGMTGQDVGLAATADTCGLWVTFNVGWKKNGGKGCMLIFRRGSPGPVLETNEKKKKKERKCSEDRGKETNEGKKKEWKSKEGETDKNEWWWRRKKV